MPSRRSWKFVRNIFIFLDRRGASSCCSRCSWRCCGACPGPGVRAAADLRRRLHGPVPWRADDPGHPAARLRDAGARAPGRADDSDVFWAIVALVARLLRVRGGGVPSRDRVRPPEPDRRPRDRSVCLAGSRCGYVVLPQAVRRVIPPLLNDFIGLQKDSALVALPRRHRGASAGADHPGERLQLHAVRRAGARLHRHHDPPGAVRRLADRARPASSPGRGATCDRVASRIEGLHKSFDELEVLKGIDLVVDDHEVVCLIGASGSGKSTLLRCIDLLEPIDAGPDRDRGGRRSPRRGRRRRRRPPQDRASSSSRSTSSRT